MKNTLLFFILRPIAPRSIFVFLFLFLFLAPSPAHAQKSALLWATYFGGDTTVTSNSGTGTSSIATDASGNVYIFGTTYSAIGIATFGAYQTLGDSVNGDAFLAKFNPTGKLLWATYYGGKDEDDGYGIAIDAMENVYITGATYSTSGIATSGAYKTKGDNLNGDAFLAKFDSTGSLLWGTYYGGGNYDYGGSAAIDASGYIYISGTTNSSAGIATNGAYQTNGDSIGGDAFLAKFSSSGNLLWGTYYGGNHFTYGFSMAIDISSNIYITGETQSSSGIATSGAYQSSFSIASVAFLAKFNTSGGLLWGTYYGGGDWGIGLATDIFSNIYLTGTIGDSINIATSGAYQTSFGGGTSDVFLTKFSPSGNLRWSTYYGGSGNEEGGGIAIDTLGNVYISGLTSSTSRIATTAAYQTSLGSYSINNNYDVFLTKFNLQGDLLWGSYFGGTSEIEGGLVTIDLSGNVYIAGQTYSVIGLATPGAFQTIGNNVEGDAFLAKFQIKTLYIDGGISTVLSPAKGSFCSDLKPVKVLLKNYGPDTLKSVKINWEINSNLQTPYNWTDVLNADSTAIVNLGSYNFTNGIDTIIAWASLPIGIIDTVPGNDTAIIIDTVNPLPNANTGNNLSVCKGDSIKIGGNAILGNTYSWTSNPLGYSSTVSNPVVSPTTTTTYILTETVTATGCSKTDSVIIMVNPLPVALFRYKLFGNTVKFTPANTTYTSYLWSFGDSDTSDQVSPSHSYTNNGIYTASLTVTDKNGCTATYKTIDTIDFTGIANAHDNNFHLSIYPNPFTSAISISYSIPEYQNVLLTLTDITGKQIAMLTNENQNAGQHIYTLDADKYNIPEGIYFLRMVSGNDAVEEKVVRIK